MLINDNNSGRIFTQMSMDHSVQAANVLQSLAEHVAEQLSGERGKMDIKRSMDGSSKFSITISHKGNQAVQEEVVSKFSTKESILQMLAEKGIR